MTFGAIDIDPPADLENVLDVTQILILASYLSPINNKLLQSFYHLLLAI